MKVYVLEGHVLYENSVVLGVYETRLEAIFAAINHRDADKASERPQEYDYYLTEKVIGAPAEDRMSESEEIQME